MCEKCEMKAKARGGQPLPAELVEKAKKFLIELADKTIDADGLAGVDPARQAQENEAMEAATGVTLHRVWEIYTEMTKGPITLTAEEARGFSRFITILARTRADLAMKLDEAMQTLQLAAMLEQLREVGERESSPAHNKLPMVDLGYGLAGGGKGGPKRDN